MRTSSVRRVIPRVFLTLAALVSPWAAQAGSSPRPQQGPPGALLDPGVVLAEVGPQTITVGDFLLYLREVNPRIDLATLSESDRRHYLEEFLSRKLYSLRARESGVDRDPGVRARLDFFIDGVLAQALKDRLVRDIQIPESEVLAYYKDHLGEFQTPPRVLLRHLLYKSPQGAAALKRLRPGAGETLEADDRATDPDLVLAERRWFTADLLVPPVAEAAFRMPVGEVGEVIHTTYGYHVLRVEQREEGRRRDFADCRAEILDKVRQAKTEAVLLRALDEIRARSDVRLHFEAVPLDKGGPGGGNIQAH